MPLHEWSLVLFTILMQASVGLLLASEAARLVAGGPADGLLSWQTPAACALAALGLLLSLSHLGTPTHSMFTILNVTSSWLSREILSTGAFFLSLLGLTAARIRNPGRHFLPIAAVTVLLGLTAMAVMSRVYLLVSVPVWDTVATVLSFFGTALLTGAVVGGLLHALQSGRLSVSNEKPPLSGVFCIVAILGLALQFLGIPLSVAAIGTASTPALADPFTLSSGGLGLLALRIILVFFGTVLFAWIMFRPLSDGNPRLLLRLSVFALVCVLAGEMLGRFMFYGSYLRVGL